MDGSSQNSLLFCFQKLHHSHSFKRTSLFLFFFFLFVLVLLGVSTLIILFVVKPQKPVFSFQTLSLDLYEFKAFSSSTLFVSSVITLALNAQNPNKLGLRYTASRLQIYNEGLSIGTIRVPGFLQAAHSYNMTVPMRILFPCVNVSHALEEASSQEGSRKNILETKILGDVRVHLLAFHITLLKIKVALECDINVDVGKLIQIRNEVYTTKGVKDHMASFPTNSQTIFRKCSLAFYI